MSIVSVIRRSRHPGSTLRVEVTYTDRYTRMACCACPADWVEDRLEPGPRCPRCQHYEPWPLLENCAKLQAIDEGLLFEATVSGLAKLLTDCAFQADRRPARQPGRSLITRRVYTHKDGGPSRSIEIAIDAFPEEDMIRSLMLTYKVGKTTALQFMPATVELMLEYLTIIVQTIRATSSVPIPAADVLFCNHPIAE